MHRQFEKMDRKMLKIYGLQGLQWLHWDMAFGDYDTREWSVACVFRHMVSRYDS